MLGAHLTQLCSSGQFSVPLTRLRAEAPARPQRRNPGPGLCQQWLLKPLQHSTASSQCCPCRKCSPSHGSRSLGAVPQTVSLLPGWCHCAAGEDLLGLELPKRAAGQDSKAPG